MAQPQNETNPEVTEPSSYSRWAPLLMGFFVGPLGFHRIWVGRFPSGITMFAFTGMAMYVIYRHPELVAQAQRGETPTTVPADFLWGCLLLLVTSVWATVDCLRIAVGKFKDGAGYLLTEWY
jgi:hypothetical protein